MKNLALSFLLLLFTASCNSESNDVDKESREESSLQDNETEDWLSFDDKRFNIPLGKVLFDTLTLSAQFDECGEWGGHKEKVIIYSNDKQELFLNYIEDKVDCDSLFNKGFSVIVVDKTQVLAVEDQKVIIEYLQKLIEESFKFNIGSHAGRYYSAFTKDTSFIVSYHDVAGQWEEYEKMKAKIID